MKKSWVWIAVIVLILVVGYMGRDRIKTMLGGYSSQQSTQTQNTTSVPSQSVSPSQTSNNNIVMTKTDTLKGNYLSDPRGMTLYTFDKDQSGGSNCTGSCATIWPPYIEGSMTSSSMPTNITTIKRSDGSMQYAWKGMPLYYYAKDQQPGDTIGNGVGGVWHLAKP